MANPPHVTPDEDDDDAITGVLDENVPPAPTGEDKPEPGDPVEPLPDPNAEAVPEAAAVPEPAKSTGGFWGFIRSLFGGK